MGEAVAEKYPLRPHGHRGKVRNLTNYGAFVEIEEGIDGLLHVTDMSWTKKISHPSELVKKGDPMECVVLSVDTDKKRIALGLKQLAGDPWDDSIPSRYIPGTHFRGAATKLTNFGVFVELEPGLEGLLHVSQLREGSDQEIANPEDVLKTGQRLDVRVLRVDAKERKIGLALSVPLSEQKLEGDDKAEATPELGVPPVNAPPVEPAPAGASESAPTVTSAAPEASGGQGDLGAALQRALQKRQEEEDAAAASDS